MAKRSDTNTAIANLMKWAQRPEWAAPKEAVFEQHVQGACERLELSARELLGELSDSGYLGMVFGVAFEDFAARRFGSDDANVIDDYLKRRGWHESYRGRQYLQGLRDSLLSLYEVADVAAGRHVDVVDLVRGGGKVRVHEKLGSEQFVRWDRFAARVVEVEGCRHFGGGLLVFDPAAADSLLRVLRSTRERLAKALGKGDGPEAGGEDILAPLVLRQSSYVFSQIWLEHAYHALHEPPPRLVNTHGEEILFAEARLPLRTSAPAAVIAALDAAPEWERSGDDPPAWRWLGRPQPSGAQPERQSGSGQPLLGTVELRGGALVLTANSRERVERGCAALAGLLGGRVGRPLTIFRAPDELEDTSGADEGPDEGAGPVSELSEAERRQLTAAVKDNHYRATLDEPVSVLGGQTPRQCAKTPAGAEQVVAWLKSLENNELRSAAAQGVAPYDFLWMWRELGLEARRPE